MKGTMSLLAVGLLPVVILPSCQKKLAEQPNVILILTDDQGWGDLASNGNTEISTPNLDKLRAESAVLDRFYVSPLSAPTRASLLTGRYHLSTGVSSVQSGLENMNPEETTIAELFKAEGYATGCFGKWHSGAYYPLTPNGQGFDSFLGYCCGHWANYVNPQLQENELMTTREGYITDILTDEAIDFIKTNKEKPFFCYIPYNSPHSPFQVPDEYYEKYSHLENKAIATIYAMVENVDDNVGRIMKYLDEENLRENTVIVFMSDNGPTYTARYNGGMKGMKMGVFEGSVRVPCFVSWKGTIEPKVLDYPSAHIDMLPTLMELCDIENYSTNFAIDGISLTSLLDGSEDYLGSRGIGLHVLGNNDTASVWNIADVITAKNKGGYLLDTLRLSVEASDTTLYNLAQDPEGMIDIYDPENTQHKDLLGRYQKWYEIVSENIVNGGNVVPVGYEQAREVRIPTPEGDYSGDLKCYGYPNQNWVNHFCDKDDVLGFNIEIVNGAEYEVLVEYSYEQEKATASLNCQIGDEIVSNKIPYFPAQTLPAPDRVPRGEAYPMKWNRLSLGKLTLDKGEHTVKLYAEGVDGEDDLKIFNLVIKRCN